MKYLVVVSVLFFASISMADEIVFDRTTNVGVQQRDVLRFEKGHYYFDGKDLGRKLPPMVQGAWKEIETGPTERQPASCFAGNYVYSKSISGSKKKIVRKGCTFGPEFGRLMQNLEDLRSYARSL